MRSTVSFSLLAASLMSVVAAQDAPSETRLLIPTPTATVAAGALINMGCYTDGSNLQDHGPGQFQTDGTCQQICLGLQMPVMAIWRGSNCFCGTELPALEYLDETNASCTSTCNGFGELTCGGPKAWTVWDTALFSGGLENFDPSTVTSSAPSQPTNAAQSTEQGSSTTSAVETESSNSGGGPNTAGIAAGVVVGVLAIAAIIGGTVLFLKRRKRKAVEEEYQRNAAMKDFYGKPPGTGHSSLTDNRLDPETQMRRQSNGSIADNQDFSRRVLQIRNPDSP